MILKHSTMTFQFGWKIKLNADRLFFLLENRWSCQHGVGDEKLLTQFWFWQHILDVGSERLYRCLTVTNNIWFRTSCTNIRHQCCCVKKIMSNCEPLGSCPRERHTIEQKEVVIDLNYLQRRAVGVWHRSRIQDFVGDVTCVLQPARWCVTLVMTNFVLKIGDDE